MIMPLQDDNNGVRLAVREDEDELMAMVQEMHPEAALRQPGGEPIALDEDMAREKLHRAIVPGYGHNEGVLPAWIGVLGERGAIKGSVYLSCATTWYSRHIILVEEWLFVRRAHRRSTAAATLADFAKQSADAVNIHPLIVGHMSSGREEAKSRFYRRHFGSQIGGYYAHHGAQAGVL